MKSFQIKIYKDKKDFLIRCLYYTEKHGCLKDADTVVRLIQDLNPPDGCIEPWPTPNMEGLE